MNLSAPFVRRPIATVAADDRRRARRHRRLLRAAGLAAAAGRLPDHLGQRAAARARAPTRWRRASRRRSSGASGTIAGVNEMTSSSQVGSARISLQFDLSRNIDGAAREVQAAINAVARRPAGHAAQQPDLPQGATRPTRR